MIDYYYVSDESEQLSEIQKRKLDVLKQQPNEKDDESTQKI